MAPRPRISKDMILEASMNIVRQDGSEKLTARYISEKLHCSTQPILYYFSSVEEIRSAVFEKVDQFHSAYILPRGKYANPLLEIGMNYVRFGYEEKQYFQFLFQSNRFSGTSLMELMEAPELMQILEMVSAGMKISPDQVKDVFLSLFITAHGCASLLAGNAMEYEEEKIEALLRRSFRQASADI